MRNLKRVLSLALSAIMLMGMMIMGTGAVDANDFGDADQIGNKEAVTILTGLEIIKGVGDGNFDPKGKVDRAQMAGIICKIINGSDFDVSNFIGSGNFMDVPVWAEGYVNWCAGSEIIEGYGDGRFGATDPVQAWQASLMLQRALGWWDRNDADSNSRLNSPSRNLNVTADGQKYCRLYDGLENVGVEDELTREQVAVMVYNALFAQRVHYDDVRGLYTKDGDRNVVVNSGMTDPSNTLADNIFGLYKVEGVVMANGYTNKNYSSSSTSDALTSVRFTEATDLNQDSRFEYAEGDEYAFLYDTGLDLIGHAVDVYYTMDKRTPNVVAMIDQATNVGYITYDPNNTNLSDAATAAGFRRNSILDWAEDTWFVNYDLYTTVADYITDKAAWSDGTAVALTTVGRNSKVLSAGSAPIDKHVLLISNSGNMTVDCVIVLDQYLDTVAQVDDTKRDPRYYLSSKSGGADVNVPTYANVAEEDYVIVTPIGLDNKIAAFEKAEVISSNITRFIGITNPNKDVKRVIAGGVTYKGSPVWYNTELTNVEAFVNISTEGEANLALDRFGDLIALIEEVSAPSYAYVAQFGVWHSTVGIKTVEQLVAHVFWADGTDGTYLVDDFCNAANGKDSILGTGIVPTDIEGKVDDLFTSDNSQHSINDGNWQGATVFVNTDKAAVDSAGLLGVWNVTLKSNGHITIAVPQTDNDAAATVANSASKDAAGAAYKVGDDAARLSTGHSTFVYTKDNTPVKGMDDSATKGPNDNRNSVLYQNNETVYFYPNQYSRGAYDPKKIEVEVVTGVGKAHTHTNSGLVDAKKADGKAGADAVPDAGKPQITQAWTNQGARVTVGAVLVEGYAVSSSKTTYYYNTGNYSVARNSDGVTYDLIYTVFTLKGEETELTYGGFATSQAAKAAAATKWDGFYTNGDTDLDPSTGPVSDANNSYNHKGQSGTSGNAYVVNDNARYWTYIGTNTFTDKLDIGFLNSKVVVVDTRQDVLYGATEPIDSIAKMQRAVNGKDGGNLLVAYVYSNSNYEASVLYISEYDPDVYVERPTEDPNVNLFVKVEIDWYAENHTDPTVTIRHIGETNIAADVEAVRQAIADLWNIDASQVTTKRVVDKANSIVVWTGTVPGYGEYELVEEYISTPITTTNEAGLQELLDMNKSDPNYQAWTDLNGSGLVTHGLDVDIVESGSDKILVVSGKVITFDKDTNVPAFASPIGSIAPYTSFNANDRIAVISLMDASLTSGYSPLYIAVGVTATGTYGTAANWQLTAKAPISGLAANVQTALSAVGITHIQWNLDFSTPA